MSSPAPIDSADVAGLSSTEVVRQLGGRLSYRQLDYWVRQGRIRPSIVDTDGTGYGRVWSPLDVIALAAILDVLERHEREKATIASGDMWAELHAGLRKV